MDSLFKGIIGSTSECGFDDIAIQRCPFLRNIDKPTSFSFLAVNFPGLGATKGPIFEDGPNFDMAFKLFHGKDGVVPLSNESAFHDAVLESEPAPQFNPLAGKAATISLSAFGPGGPFGFGPFNDNRNKQKKKSEPGKKRKPSSQEGNTPKHEALGNEWLRTGNCPIAKSYRAVSHVLPLVASTLRPPPGMKLRCPPAVVAARAALARTAFVKTLRPQPLPAKMLVIAMLGMAANVPLGMWKEHTDKFSLAWFAAVHAAVPFIAMLRKSVVMPKTAMALTIGASIIGQVIGSRAERQRLKLKAKPPSAAVAMYGPNHIDSTCGNSCGKEGIAFEPMVVNQDGPTSSSASICC
ncbi:unnamed protein product [Linum trigynum]|uniref:Uncharacterized protein n=1 Tax=Linum trigynum TaxID=586398 RepID=A0AAV2EKZ5_9ROSI